MRRMLTTTAVAAALLGLPAFLSAQDPSAQPASPGADPMKVVSAKALAWAAIQPEGFDPGMEIAAISGDPAVPDQPYTLRLRFKDGYRFPAHYHPKTENVTVLRGTLLLNMGDVAMENLHSYTAGDYLYLPPLQPHYGGAKGETEIQVHGVGPFEIMLAKAK